MRHRFLCPLYDRNPRHLDLINHLIDLPKNDRGRELAMLALAGFQVVYKGDPMGSSPISSEFDSIEVLRQILNKSGVTPPSDISREESDNSPGSSNKRLESEPGKASQKTNNSDESASPSEEKTKRVFSPPKVNQQPSEDLLDSPLVEEDSESEGVTDPLATISKMF